MSARESAGLTIPPNRIESALRRARAAQEVAQHHERAAAAERAKIATLARTWNFCAKCLAVEDCPCD